MTPTIIHYIRWHMVFVWSENNEMQAEMDKNFMS